MNVIPVGADIGNATVSAASGDRIAFFPSFVATTRRSYSGGNIHHVSYDGVNYVIGDDALDMPGHDSLMAEALTEEHAHKRYLTPRSFAAFLASVSALYPGESHLDIDLGTGLPLSLYEPHGAEVAQHYQGAHVYSYQGRPRTLTVHTSRVFGEGLEVIRLLPAAERMGKIALHDLGGRTYGIALFNNGALKSRRAYDAGIDRLLSDIAIVSNDPGARWHIQQEMRRDPKAHASLRAELAQSIKDALTMAEGKQRLADAERHIVIGGGALAGAPIIKARYGKPVIIVDKVRPETVNARAIVAALSEV